MDRKPGERGVWSGEELGLKPNDGKPDEPKKPKLPYDPKQYDKVLSPPKPGDLVELDPGQKALFLFEFSNKLPCAASYSLQVEDDLRPTHDVAYVKRLVWEANIGDGAKETFAFEVVIPSGALPRTLRIRATHGLQSGEPPQTVVAFGVKVTPLIAVGLAAPKPRDVVGPFKRVPEVPLAVENVGNVATAYRLILDETEPPPKAIDPDDPKKSAGPTWYIALSGAEADVAPGDRSEARVRMHRTGIWWLGWRETQKAKAVALPVTDPRNAGRAGNDVEIEGMRWRLLPFPWFVALPLALAFFALFLGGYGIDGVTVDNAIRSKVAPGVLYVMQDRPESLSVSPSRPPVKIPVRLHWDAPFFSLAKLDPQERKGQKDPEATTHGDGYHRAVATRTLTEYEGYDRFQVRSLLNQGTKLSETVVYVPTRTSDDLTLRILVAKATKKGGFESDIELPTPPAASGGGGEPGPYAAMERRDDEDVDGTPRMVVERTIKVGPHDRVRIRAENEAVGRKILLYARDLPKEYLAGSVRTNEANTVNEATETKKAAAGAKAVIEPGRLNFTLVPRAFTNKEDDLWFLTTDKAYPIFHLRILRTARGGK